MNIIAISMVKNEEDIIELFCRYTLGFCDKLLVLEDNSDDSTPEILSKLSEEGLPIVILEKSFETGFYKFERINELAAQAFEEFGADLVVPLDADEFVTTDTNTKVRNVLEGLQADIRYLFPWRTYVLTEEASLVNGDMFQRFDSFRPAELEEWPKIVVSRELFVDCGYRIGLGQHELEPSPESPAREELVSNELIFAHYPVRSIGQASNRIIIGWLNYLSMPNERRKSGHWPIMFETIKKEGSLSFKQAEYYSFYYSVFSEDVDKSDLSFKNRLTKMPLNTDLVAEEGKLLLHFTPESNNENISIGLLMLHFVKMIEAFKKENVEAMLKAEELKASNSWRIGRVITSPVRLIKKLFKAN